MSEYFSGVTFPFQSVTPSDDAIVRRAALTDGSLSGFSVGYSGYTLTVDAGYAIACGRLFRHAAAQNWAVTGASSGYARLVLTVDVTRTSTKDTFDQITDSIQYASSLDGFLPLTQEDINQTGRTYQIVVCVVSLGVGGITGVVSQMAAAQLDAPTRADLSAILAMIKGSGLGVANIYALTPIRSHAELDILRGNGWYGWIADLEIAPGSSTTGIIRRETSSENYCTQWFTGLSGDRLVCSYIYGQGWTPWKWENPFMLWDAEYATTEFFNGMTVYTKMAVYSPDSFTEQTISLPHGISGLFRGLSVDVHWQHTDATGTVTQRRFPNVYYNSAEWSGQAFFFGNDRIKFELGSTLLKNIKGSADNVYVILKYVKA